MHKPQINNSKHFLPVTVSNISYGKTCMFQEYCISFNLTTLMVYQLHLNFRMNRAY